MTQICVTGPQCVNMFHYLTVLHDRIFSHACKVFVALYCAIYCVIYYPFSNLTIPQLDLSATCWFFDPSMRLTGYIIPRGLYACFLKASGVYGMYKFLINLMYFHESFGIIFIHDLFFFFPVTFLFLWFCNEYRNNFLT
jgi:hypothetical protein